MIGRRGFLLNPQFANHFARRQVVARAPRLKQYNDESVLVVLPQVRVDDSDARAPQVVRKSRLLKSDTITLGTESLSRAPPRWD